MKLADLRILEKNLRAVEAHNRLARHDDVKGLMIQVVFEDNRQGDTPVQLFIAPDHADYDKVMAVVDATVGEVRAQADAKVAELSAKLADSVGKAKA